VAEIKTFSCLKCGKSVDLVFTPWMAEETFNSFIARLNAQLCRDCFVHKKEEVTCLH